MQGTLPVTRGRECPEKIRQQDLLSFQRASYNG